MTVEAFSYISSLNASYPAAGDARSEGDDHIRGLKTTLLNSFPSVAGAVTATHTELNYVDGVTSAIQTQLDAKAPLASPALTGTPTAPTATTGTNTTQIATCAFVQQEVSVAAGGSFLPLGGGTMTGQIVGKASNTTSAPLNLPHGVAPTSPVNGDIWSTTAGIYARLNGSTVNLYNAGGSGTVTSVALSLPNIFSVSGSPVTSSGTLSATLASQTQNLVFASPASGTGTPLFRALASSDLPSAPNFGGGVTTTTINATGNITTTADMYSAGLYTTGAVVVGDTLDVNGRLTPHADDSFDLGAPTYQWQDCYLVNAATVSSDARFKRDIETLTDGLALVNRFRPVSYRRIDGSRTHTGFIAQEVKQALPEGVDWAGWVMADKDDPESRQSLRYDEFVAILVSAVQELSARVVRLEKDRWG